MIGFSDQGKYTHKEDRIHVVSHVAGDSSVHHGYKLVEYTIRDHLSTFV